MTTAATTGGKARAVGEAPDVLTVLGADGALVHGARVPHELGDHDLVEALTAMLRKRLVDRALMRLVEAQRIRRFAGAIGCEGALAGAAWALNAQDWVFPGEREGGVALMRGLTVDDYMAQALSTVLDRGGARLPPGSTTAPEQQVATPGPPGAARVAHAVGVALAMRGRGTNAVAAVFLGADELDASGFHPAAVLAVARRLPVIVYVLTQLLGDDAPASAIRRAQGVGMRSVCVDGHDVLASYVATRDAVRHAREGRGPTFIEARVRRLDRLPDDRAADVELADWRATDPIERLVALAMARGALDVDALGGVEAELSAEVDDVLAIMQVQDGPRLASLVDDVYVARPWWLYERQQGEA